MISSIHSCSPGGPAQHLSWTAAMILTPGRQASVGSIVPAVNNHAMNDPAEIGQTMQLLPHTKQYKKSINNECWKRPSNHGNHGL